MSTTATPTPPLPPLATSADLRRLYGEAEARATRLRALLETSRLLAVSQGADLDAALAAAAERASLLAGYRVARVAAAGEALPGDALVFPLVAPGTAAPMPERLVVAGPLRPGAGLAREDAEAVELIAQLMAAALAARRREARLAELLDQLLATQERERAHVARELHDGVAQLATAALRRIELAALDHGTPDAERAAELTRELVAELRRIIAGMRPTALDDLGLAPAVAQLARALEASGCTVTLDVDALPALPPAVETGLFRLAQESLGNVGRHAAPCAVHVRLALTTGGARELVPNVPLHDALHDAPHDALAGDGPAHVTLTVRDAGPGFVPGQGAAADGNGHFGLAFMAERVRALGGRLHVTAAPGAGCTVTAVVPLP